MPYYTPQYNSRQYVHGDKQREVVVKIAQKHQAAEISHNSQRNFVEAWFVEEVDCDKFDCEASVYLDQQEFLDNLSDEEAKSLGIQ